MSFARDTMHSAVSTIVLVGGRMVITVLLARHLEPNSYGQFVFLQFVIDTTGLFFSFGLPACFTRYLPSIPSSSGWRHPAARRFLGLGIGSVLLSAVGFSTYLLITSPPHFLTFLLMLSWCLAASANVLVTAALQGLFRYDAVMAGNAVFVGSALILAFIVPYSVMGGAMLMAIALALSLATSLIFCALRPRGRLRDPAHPVPPFRQMAIYGGNLWLTGFLANLVWSRGEFAILKLHVNTAEIARYSAALSLSGAITQGAALLTGALTPHIATHIGTKDAPRIRKILQTVTQAVMMFVGLICIETIALGQFVIPLLFGKVYAESYGVLCILALACTTICLNCAFTILQIEMNGRFGLFVNIAAFVCLLIGNQLLSPKFGIMGSACARLLTQLIVAVCTMWQLLRIDYLRSVTFRIMSAFTATLAILSAFYVYTRASHVDTLTLFSISLGCALTMLLMIMLAMGRQPLSLKSL